MPAPRDLSEQRFGYLVAIENVGIDKRHNRLWRCQCDCGNEKITKAKFLVSGETRSCGCFRLEQLRPVLLQRNTTHGLRHTRTYNIWASMMQRCRDPRCKSWARYGGRGIRVCPAWQTFEGFFADMGHPPSGLTLDRIDNDGNYEPSNCQWATRLQQSHNSTRSNLVSFQGMTKSQRQWGLFLGITPHTVGNRLKKYPVEIALGKYFKD